MRTAVTTDPLLTGASSKADFVSSILILPAFFDIDSTCTSSSTQGMSPRAACDAAAAVAVASEGNTPLRLKALTSEEPSEAVERRRGATATASII